MKILILIFCGVFSFFQTFSNEKNRPSGLLYELLSHPELSLITNPNPSFSWIVNSQLNNDFQTAYQIVVSASKMELDELENVFWNSGKVSSVMSSNINYRGNPLSANSTYSGTFSGVQILQ